MQDKTIFIVGPESFLWLQIFAALTKEESLSRLMNAFDLLSDQNFEPRVKKVELFYDIYGLDSEHVLKNCNDLGSVNN